MLAVGNRLLIQQAIDALHILVFPALRSDVLESSAIALLLVASAAGAGLIAIGVIVEDGLRDDVLDLHIVPIETLAQRQDLTAVQTLFSSLLPQHILADTGLRREESTLLDLLCDRFILLLSTAVALCHTLTLLTRHLQLTCQLDTDFIDAVLSLERIDEVDHLVEDLLDEGLTQLIALQQRYLLQKRALSDLFAGGAIRVAVADGCARLTIAQSLL